MKSPAIKSCLNQWHKSYANQEFCWGCDDQTRKRDRGYRARLIAAGSIVTLESKPTLWMAPGERERFEAEARIDAFLN